MLLKFTIPGRIGGKGRVRHRGRQHFMDARTRSDQQIVRHFALEKMKQERETLRFGPVWVGVHIFLLMPASWSKKKKRLRVRGPAVGKPDLDNIAKLLCDALNGVAWKDDRQLHGLHMDRWYIEDGEIERLELTIADTAGEPTWKPHYTSGKSSNARQNSTA